LAAGNNVEAGDGEQGDGGATKEDGEERVVVVCLTIQKYILQSRYTNPV
jgi:hypothetical protein